MKYKLKKMPCVSSTNVLKSGPGCFSSRKVSRCCREATALDECTELHRALYHTDCTAELRHRKCLLLRQHQAMKPRHQSQYTLAPNVAGCSEIRCAAASSVIAALAHHGKGI